MSYVLASILPESASHVISQLNQILSGTFLSGMFSFDIIQDILDQLNSSIKLGLMIIALIIAVLGCFFGYKFARFFMSITGFLLGIGIGYLVASQLLKLGSGLTVLVSVCVGLFIAGISFWIYRGILFILCFLFTFIFAADIIPFTNDIQFFLCTLAGFIVGAISQKFLRPVIILTSSIAFGIWAGFVSVDLLEFLELNIIPTSMLYKIIAGAIFSILGIVIQFMTTKEDNSSSSLASSDDN